MTASSSGNRYARFIPSEEIQQVAQWQFGAVDESVRAAMAAAEQLEATHNAENSPTALARLQQVRDEARAEGHAAGHAEATREGNERLDAYAAGQGHDAAEQLAQLVNAAQQGLDAAQQRIAQSVLDMACALARQVLRHELSQNPNALQPVIREALGSLLSDGRAATVRLHPQDLDMLRAPLKDEFGSTPVQWLADAAVPPGGCLVESAGTVIDGRLQSRWERAIGALGLEAPWQPEADTPEQAHD
jgi:flagellar assembly protein FliH